MWAQRDTNEKAKEYLERRADYLCKSIYTDLKYIEKFVETTKDEIKNYGYWFKACRGGLDSEASKLIESANEQVEMYKKLIPLRKEQIEFLCK